MQPHRRDQPKARSMLDSTNTGSARQRFLKLIAAYGHGESIKQLAQRFGIHRMTVTALLRRHGVELRRAGLTSDDVVAASRLYAHGWSLAKLGRKFPRQR